MCVLLLTYCNSITQDFKKLTALTEHLAVHSAVAVAIVSVMSSPDQTNGNAIKIPQMSLYLNI